MRKVLGMKSTKRKREIYNVVTVISLLLAVGLTFLICRLTDNSFFDSWASSLGESCVAGVILIMQIGFIKNLSALIKESDLDMVPVRRNFCANLSVVGFIFLVQCGDLALHVFTTIFA